MKNSKLIFMALVIIPSLSWAKKVTIGKDGEPDAIYLDCDQDGKYNAQVDFILNSADLFRNDGSTSVLQTPPSPSTIPALPPQCVGAGIVFPKKANVAGHQLEVVVEGDIHVNSRLAIAWFASNTFPKEILNDSRHNIAFVYGLIKLHSLKGSIIFDQGSFSVNVGAYDLQAAKDIIFNTGTRLAQFKAGYLEPVPFHFPETPVSQYATRKRGPQRVKAGRDFILKDKAALDSSDQLVVTAGGKIEIGSKAYFRGRNDFCLKAETGGISFGPQSQILADHVSLSASTSIDVSLAMTCPR